MQQFSQLDMFVGSAVILAKNGFFEAIGKVDPKNAKKTIGAVMAAANIYRDCGHGEADGHERPPIGHRRDGAESGRRAAENGREDRQRSEARHVLTPLAEAASASASADRRAGTAAGEAGRRAC